MVAASESKGEHSSILSVPESIHDSLTHEKSNCDTDCHCNHSTSNVNAVSICSDTSCLRKPRLNSMVKKRLGGRYGGYVLVPRTGRL